MQNDPASRAHHLLSSLLRLAIGHSCGAMLSLALWRLYNDGLSLSLRLMVDLVDAVGVLLVPVVCLHALAAVSLGAGIPVPSRFASQDFQPPPPFHAADIAGDTAPNWMRNVEGH